MRSSEGTGFSWYPQYRTLQFKIRSARTQKVRAFCGMKNVRYKIERKLDRYNHLMELIRTLTGLTVLVLQLILLYTIK